MKTKMKLACIVAMGVMSACTSEDTDFGGTVTSEKYTERVHIVSDSYTFVEGTRTTLANTGSSISFAWDDDETIGIFPIAPCTNAQAYQKLEGGTDEGLMSSFDGAGWSLKKGNSYAAYYPYNGNLPSITSYTDIPVDNTGQTQSGDNSLSHIGQTYDYQYSFAGIPANSKEVTFHFKHINSIVMLQLQLPEDADLTSAILENRDGEKVFTTKALMDVSDGTVRPVEQSIYTILDLKNIHAKANQQIRLYSAIIPTYTGNLDLTVTTAEGKEYVASLSAKTLEAGHAYAWSTTLSQRKTTYDSGTRGGHDYVDLGVSVKWATTNLGTDKVIKEGLYYAWGETKGNSEEDESNLSNLNYNSDNIPFSTYSATASCQKEYFGWKTYKYSNGGISSSNANITKYCNDESRGYEGFTDELTELEIADDAVAQSWGEDWRTPTQKEMNELLNKCYWEYTTNYNKSGMNGYIVYRAKNIRDKGVHSTEKEKCSTTGSYSLSDAHIFLPFAGYYTGSGTANVKTNGYYYTSTMNEKCNVAELYLSPNSASILNINSRCLGRSIRGVR